MTTRLTDLGVERLKPSDKRREIPDGGCPGLFLQLQPSGSKSWAVRCRVDGKPTKLTLGPYPRLSLQDARERTREMLALVDRGVDPRAEAARLRDEKAAADANTLRAIAERFRDQRMKAARPATWKDSWSALDRFVLSKLGDRAIDAVRRRDLIEVIDRLAKKPGAWHHVVNAVGTLFAWAADREFIESNPAVRLPRPKGGVRQRVLSDAEIPVAWRAAEVTGYPYGRLVQLLLLTGCRRNELAGLQWSEIDEKAGVITIPPTRFKSARTHAVPLSAVARDLVDGLPRLAGPFVFSTRGGRRPISGFSKMHARFEQATLAKQCEAEGVEPFTFDLHDLRRTVRTGMSALRIQPHVAEAVLGHVIVGVQRHYDRHTYLPEKTEALEAWASHVQRLLHPSENVVALPRRPQAADA